MLLDMSLLSLLTIIKELMLCTPTRHNSERTLAEEAEAKAVYTRCTFKLPCHYVTPAVTSHALYWTDITSASVSGHTEVVSKRSDTVQVHLKGNSRQSWPNG